MKLGKLLAQSGNIGYAYMAVIPGSVGGAVLMNAGTTMEGEIKDHFASASVFDPLTEEVKEYERLDIRFGYRQSSLLKSKSIVLQAAFKLCPKDDRDADKALQTIKLVQQKRRAKQPENPKTFGSTFKTTKGNKSAGWYLEQVGMKGLRCGDAMVSIKHANWIENVGEATSSDIKKLIVIGKQRVLDKFGVSLEREVIFFPEDIS
jgi:UDP-N-acetylmuramate dehydrogenase